MLDFRSLLEGSWAADKFVCVGLDSDLSKIPYKYIGSDVLKTMTNFTKDVIERTGEVAATFKANLAFFEGEGVDGEEALEISIEYILSCFPWTPIILDYKRGDIGNTNIGYIRSAFERYKAHAVTVHNYMGQESLQDFLDMKDKGIFVLCRTSNPGAGEFQDLKVGVKSLELAEELKINSAIEHYLNGGQSTPTIPLWQYVAHSVSEKWNGNGNCGLVVGATAPQELKVVRQIAPNLPVLIPGIGAQGGDLEAAVRNAMNPSGTGFIVNSSRGIIFADDPGTEAKKLHEAINQIRER